MVNSNDLGRVWSTLRTRGEMWLNRTIKGNLKKFEMYQNSSMIYL